MADFLLVLVEITMVLKIWMNRVSEGNTFILCHKKLLGGTQLQASHGSCNPITYKLTRVVEGCWKLQYSWRKPLLYTEKFCYRKKLPNVADHEPFPKIFLTNIHRYMENTYGICTDCCLFAFPIAFTCMVHQPTKYFPCTVYPIQHHYHLCLYTNVNPQSIILYVAY